MKLVSVINQFHTHTCKGLSSQVPVTSDIQNICFQKKMEENQAFTMFGMNVSHSCVGESTKYETVLPLDWLHILFSKSSCSADSVAETESPLHCLPGGTSISY